MGRGAVYANPNYTKSKKNPQPKFLTAATPKEILDHDRSLNDLYGDRQAAIQQNLSYMDPYLNDMKNYGVTPNPSIEDIDATMAKAQPALKKMGSALSRTLVSEILLGTIKSVPDVIDALGQASGIIDEHDYTNAVSGFFENLQDDFEKNYAPIYATPGVDISNGGLTDWGWYASNIPSIASSVTMLLPAMAGARILKGAASFLEAGAATRAVVRGATRAIGNAKLYRMANSAINIERANKAMEIGTTALISRTIENYQEGRVVYKDSYRDARETLELATPEEYNMIIAKNKSFLQGVDTSDKDAVAKRIASAGADYDFKMNYLNTMWDVIQLYALRNMMGSKMLGKKISSSASIRRAQRNSIRYAGKTDEEIAALEKARSFGSKAKERIGDFLVGSKTATVIELSEGFEEGWNYISQMEGMHVGNLMLGKDKPSIFDNRLGSYIRSPQLYESALWGVIGGVVFNAAGSRVKRAWNTVEENHKAKKAAKKKEATGEEAPEVGWKGLSLLPEVKRVVTDIEGRSEKSKRLADQLKNIDNGVNPFDPSQTLDTEEEKEVARQQAKKMYVTSLTLNSLNNGTFNMTKEYIADDRVRKAMVEQGLVKEEDSRQWQQDVLSDMEKISDLYSGEIDRLNLLSTSYKGKTSLEFLQIAATDNVYHAMTAETFEGKRDEALADYNRKKEAAIKDGKINGMLPYETNMQLHARVNTLYALYDQRRAIRQRYERDGKLSDKVAFDNIDKIIKEQQRNLYIEALDKNLVDIVFAMNNVYQRNREQGEIDADIESMITDVTQGKFEKFEELFGVIDEDKKPKTAEDLVKFNQELNKRSDLYRKGMAEIDSIDGAREDYEKAMAYSMAAEMEISQIIGTKEEFKDYMTVQNNTLTEARKNAIDKSYETIKEMSKKYGFDTIDTYMDTVITGRHKSSRAVLFQDMTEEDKQRLDDAIDVLNFSDVPNQNVRETIVGMMQAARLAQESEEKTEDEEAVNNPTPPPTTPTTPNSSSEGTRTTRMNNNPAQPSEGSRTQENEQSEDAEGSAQQSEDNRTPIGYARFHFNRNGILYLNTRGRRNGANAIPLLSTENEGEYELDVRNSNNESLVSSDELFDSEDGVSVIDGQYEIKSNPIVRRFQGAYRVVRKGELVNPENVIEQEREAREEQAGGEETGEESQPVSPPVEGNGETVVPETPATPASAENGGEGTGTEGQEETGTGSNAEDENGGSPTVPTTPVNNPTPPPANISSTGGLDGSVAIDKTSDNYIKYNRYVAQEFGKYVNIRETYSDIDSVLNEAAEQVRAVMEKAGVDENLTNAVIEDRIKSTKQAYNFVHKLNNPIQREGVILAEAAVDEGTAARSTESGVGFSNVFTDAFDSFVKEYAKVQFAPMVDGKYVISLVDLMRICTANYVNRQAVGNAMFDAIRDYLLSDEGKNRYVVVDDNNLTNSDFIRNLGKTRNESDGKYSAQRVDIKDFMQQHAENPGEESEKYFKTLNSVKAGDKLKFRKNNKAYVIEKDGVALGYIPVPKVVKGSYVMNNMGWNTDVKMENGEVKSKFKDWLTDAFTSDNANAVSFRTLIMRAILEKGEISPKTMREFRNHPLVAQAQALGFLTGNASEYENAIKHLANLYRYTTTFQDGVNEYRNAALLRDSLQSWFDKLYGVYDTVSNVDGEAEVEVLYMNEGEINRATNGSITADYNKLNYATDGLADLSKCRLAIVDPKNQNSLVASGRTYNVDNWASGSTVIAVESRNTQPDFVKAIGITLNETDRHNVPAIREIYAAAKEEFAEVLRKAVEDPTPANVDAIHEFINSIISNKYNNSDRVALFRNTSGQVFLDRRNYNGSDYIELVVKRPNGGIYSFKIYTNVNGNPQIRVQFKMPNQKGEKSVGLSNTTNSSEVAKAGVDYLFDRILQPFCNVNISYAGIKSDSDTNANLRGFITRTDKGIKVKIGKYEKEYASYNDFIMTNNLVKVNTFIGEDGTNFTPAGTNQKNNQVMYVNLPTRDRTATPTNANEVFIDKNTNADKANEARSVLDSGVENKGRALVEVMKGKDSPFLKRIDELSKKFDIVDEVFPHDIAYDNRLNEVRRDTNGNPIWRGVVAVSASNPNARSSYRIYNNGTPSAAKFTFGEVRVGSLFLNMLASNNTDLQNEAARKLIHERLHLQLADAKVNRRYVFDEMSKIYDEFKKRLDADLKNDKLTKDERARLEAIKEAIKYYKGDRLYEEFLVESLTNRDFFDYLNGITDFEYKAEDKGNKETLFDKIARFIAKLFGWNINDKSLYNEELKMLRNAFDGSVSSREAQGPTVTETQSPTVTEETNPAETQTSEDEEALNLARQFNQDIIEDNESDEFGDMFGDEDGMFARTTESHIITDSSFTATSITDFVNSIPSDVRDGVQELVKDGYLSVTCTL